MSAYHTLDVTGIAPRLKHPTIFQHFDALQEGEAFVIHNDHDPKPLYYQLLAERGNIFNWEYIVQGPDVWEIRVAKKKLSTGEETIGQIAAKDLRKAEVFKKLGLEFCCGGNKTLEAACEDAGVPLEEVNNALEAIPEKPVRADRDYNNWKPDFLADYIVNIHHSYVQDAAPALHDLSDKITRVHGGTHPELAEIQKHVRALLQEMLSHQIKEEKILFPFIRQMVQCEKEGKSPGYPPFGTIESPVEMMKDDHNAAADHIHAIEKLSQNYEVPADGCESYRLYYYKLREFDDDLHQHIHLENNILFPKAIAMEKNLSNG
jgi:regulator of cell morphogenesis and NO signaling